MKIKVSYFILILSCVCLNACANNNLPSEINKDSPVIPISPFYKK